MSNMSKNRKLIEEDLSVFKSLEYGISIDSSTIYLEGDIETGTFADFHRKIDILLNHRKNCDEPINLIINSDGGEVYEGLAIIDWIRGMSVPVNTIVSGRACSMAAVILAAGTGTRSATKNAFIMVHELSSGNVGKLTDLVSIGQHLKQMDEILYTMLSDFTGKPKSYWTKIARNDFYMNATTALEHNLIDQII